MIFIHGGVKVKQEGYERHILYFIFHIILNANVNEEPFCEETLMKLVYRIVVINVIIIVKYHMNEYISYFRQPYVTSIQVLLLARHIS